MRVVVWYCKEAEVLFVNDMEFEFMPGKGTSDALFIFGRLHEEYVIKEQFACVLCIVRMILVNY